jgi:hypothetical protein
MNLQPGTYTCPNHRTDLTEQVREALDDGDAPPIAYWRFPVGRAAPAPRAFEVTVTCPGGAEPHPLTCTGTWTP